MKPGVNNQVNQDTKKKALKKMGGDNDKIKPPNSDPSNKLHNKALDDQGLKKLPTPPAPPDNDKPPAKQSDAARDTESVDAHHVNKALIAVGSLALVGLIIYAASGAAFS